MGKTMTYCLLPSIAQHIGCGDPGSLVMVVSPLLALMADQVDQLVKMGVKATHLGSTQPDQSLMKQILQGEWQVVLVSPELITGRL